jgi:hypothetical protein
MAVRLTYTTTNGKVTQSIKEYCEHCEEYVREVHVSEITFKAKNDRRVLKVKKADGSDQLLLAKDDRAEEVRKEAVTKSLLDSGDDITDLKYRMRPEAFCSQSVDTLQGITSSFCYRVSHPKVLAKFGNTDGVATIFANAEDSSAGKKKGLRRLKSGENYSTANVVEKLKSEDTTDTSDYEYPWNIDWIRASSDERVDEVLNKERDCEIMRNRAGNYRTYDLWRAAAADQCR